MMMVVVMICETVTSYNTCLFLLANAVLRTLCLMFCQQKKIVGVVILRGLGPLSAIGNSIYGSGCCPRRKSAYIFR